MVRWLTQQHEECLHVMKIKYGNRNEQTMDRMDSPMYHEDVLLMFSLQTVTTHAA